jgi:5-methylcytosine-specific restriction protein A
MSELRQEFGGKETKEILAHRAKIIRTRLSGLYEDKFSIEEIDLEPTDPYTRLAMYEPGHAFGSVFYRDRLPSLEILLSDTSSMIELYNIATYRGGTSEFDAGQPTPDPIQPSLQEMTMDEVRRYRLHRRIERNPRLALEAKRIHGYTCKVCDFNFEDQYGELGHQYIEAHHLTPLSQLPPNQHIQLSPKFDFVVLCANCHRMIHRTGAPKTFEEFLMEYSSEPD